MGRVRVHWRGIGKVAAAAALGLGALQILPGLLEPPQAPPLAADVGLPQVPVAPEGAVEIEAPHEQRRRERPRPKPRPSHGVSAATAVIGTTPRRHKPKRRERHGDLLPHTGSEAPTPPPPPPAPAPEPPPYVPPPAPEQPSAPVAKPPSPPGDGSVEFAPH